jgi:Holliday junction resolvase RusA-like endonuclease
MQLFEIPGKPIAWKRARRNGSMYYDCQQKEKLALQWIIKSQMKHVYSPNTAFKIELQFFIPLKSTVAKKHLKTRFSNVDPMECHKIIDIDNCVKFIFDSLNGILWDDDSWIYELNAKKVYSMKPRTIMKVYPLKGDYIGCFVDDGFGGTIG